MSVEQIDQSLLQIASHNKCSSAEVKSLAVKDGKYDAIDILGDLYQSLAPREAKWLTRLILKDFGSLKFPDDLICQANHSFLPRCVQVRAQFVSSIPDALRRDGPGSLRLEEALKSAKSLLPTPPSTLTPLSTALAALSSSAQNVSRGDGKLVAIEKASEGAHMKDKRSTATITKSSARARARTSTKGEVFRGRGRCLLAGETCPLDNCSFIIAPCILEDSWVAEKLLPWHGLNYVAPLQSHSALTEFQRNQSSRTKHRHMALVESKKRRATNEFLNEIIDLNLRTLQGEKLWVEVYDWRILECIGKIDQGKQLKFDPWKRCWIGAV